MIIDLPAATEVLGAMITPALLITASGTLALSTSNRLGRVVDRVRDLGREAEGLSEVGELAPEEAAKRGLIADQLETLYRRIHLLQTALTMLYAAIGLLVAASLSVGLVSALRSWFTWVPVGFGLAGAAALFAGSVYLVREVRVAVRMTVGEMKYVRRMVARKAGRLAE